MTAERSPGPPPLRPFGLELRRDGSFWHEGVRVTHPRLHEHFLRSVEWCEEERTFIVRLRHFRGWLDVEDTPYFVVAYDSDTGEIELTDRTRERLKPETLRVDRDGALRCQVKQRWAARFTRAGQVELLAAVDVDARPPSLRMGSLRVALPAAVELAGPG